MIKFMFGLISGIAGMFFVNYFKQKNYTYVQLKHDYRIEGIGGEAKRETKLRFDQSMSEGFTRYILYLNLKDSDIIIFKPDRKDVVIPYWLTRVDSVQNLMGPHHQSPMK